MFRFDCRHDFLNHRHDRVELIHCEAVFNAQRHQKWNHFRRHYLFRHAQLLVTHHQLENTCNARVRFRFVCFTFRPIECRQFWLLTDDSHNNGGIAGWDLRQKRNDFVESEPLVEELEQLPDADEAVHLDRDVLRAEAHFLDAREDAVLQHGVVDVRGHGRQDVEAQLLDLAYVALEGAVAHGEQVVLDHLRRAQLDQHVHVLHEDEQDVNRLLDFHDRQQVVLHVRQVLLLRRAGLRDQQHVRQHERDHRLVDELPRQARQNLLAIYPLRELLQDLWQPLEEF